MENFTPYSGFLGGALIGAAAVMLLFFNGRILGVSGIIGQIFSQPVSRSAWNLMFIAGLVLGTGLYRLFSGDGSRPLIEASVPVLVVAGLLVGVGTNLGSGCTSGHGVCGIARLSKRSIAATATFMLFGMATVFLVRQMGGG